MATEYQLKGNIAEAMVLYGLIVRAKPESSKAYYNLGVIFLKTGHLDDALKSFEEAVRWEPDWPEALKSAAWILATHPNPSSRKAS